MQFQRLRRREFIILFGGAAGVAWPMRLQAQQSRQIAVLSQGSIHTHPTPVFRAFLEGLRESGWIEGQNLSIDWRFSEGSAAPLGRLAAELVDRQVEVIVTSPTEPTLAAKRATSNIPIVFVGVADPIQAGIVTNLARPDVNVTGMSTLSTDIAGKRLALLKEALPSATRISILWNRPSKGASFILDEMQAACKKLGIEPQDIGVSEQAEIDHALDSAVRNRSAAIVVIDDPVMQGYVETVTQIAAGRKLPLISQYSQFVTKGGFLGYGPDLSDLHRRAAEYVDRILHGARPSDLPVQQPDKFNFILNLKTAKALGIEIPPTLLARADEVIE